MIFRSFLAGLLARLQGSFWRFRKPWHESKTARRPITLRLRFKLTFESTNRVFFRYYIIKQRKCKRCQVSLGRRVLADVVLRIAQHDRGHALLTSTISDKVTTVASVEMPSLLVGRPVTNSLFQKSKTMLHMSEELIRTCGEIAQILSKGEQSLELGTEWENDYKKLQLLLNTGMKATRGEIRTMMSDPHDKSKESSCERATSLPDIALWSGFSMCKADDKNVAQRDNEFWPVTARKTERGLRRMAKSLPGPPEQ